MEMLHDGSCTKEDNGREQEKKQIGETHSEPFAE